MSNRLTPALLAAATMAIANILTGTAAVSWNLFLAAAVAMLFGLGLAESKVTHGSPAGHSLATAFVVLYLAGMGAYIAIQLRHWPESTAFQATGALGAGALAHVLAELLTGRTVFTFPRNLRPGTWFREIGPDSDRFWAGWGRFTLKRHVEAIHLNALSLGIILGCIWLGGPL